MKLGHHAADHITWVCAPSENAGDELSVDAKLKLLRSNLTKFERSLKDGRISHIPEFLKDNGLQV